MSLNFAFFLLFVMLFVLYLMQRYILSIYFGLLQKLNHHKNVVAKRFGCAK